MRRIYNFLSAAIKTATLRRSESAFHLCAKSVLNGWKAASKFSIAHNKTIVATCQMWNIVKVFYEPLKWQKMCYSSGKEFSSQWKPSLFVSGSMWSWLGVFDSPPFHLRLHLWSVDGEHTFAIVPRLAHNRISCAQKRVFIFAVTVSNVECVCFFCFAQSLYLHLYL